MNTNKSFISSNKSSNNYNSRKSSIASEMTIIPKIEKVYFKKPQSKSSNKTPVTANEIFNETKNMDFFKNEEIISHINKFCDNNGKEVVKKINLPENLNFYRRVKYRIKDFNVKEKINEMHDLIGEPICKKSLTNLMKIKTLDSKIDDCQNSYYLSYLRKKYE